MRQGVGQSQSGHPVRGVHAGGDLRHPRARHDHRLHGHLRRAVPHVQTAHRHGRQQVGGFGGNVRGVM